MHVLQLTTEFEPNIWGGMGRSVSNLCKDLGKITKLTIVVNDYLFGRQEIEVEEHGDYRIVWTPTISFEDLSKVIQFDTVDVVNVQIFFFKELAEQLKSLGKPIIYTVRSIEEKDLQIRGVEVLPMHLEFMKMQRDLVEMADHLIVCSASEGQMMENYFPGSMEKLSVIPNGFIEPDGRVLQNKINGDNPPTLLFVGRFTERKGLDILIEALDLAKSQVSNLKLLVVGGHSGEDDQEWLNKLLNSYDESLQKSVEYVGWVRSLKELEPYYHAADILCVPSLYEPFGNIVLEGFYYGVPVIAANVGGMAETIQHGKSGILVPPKDAHALANAIVELIENPELYMKICLEAQLRLKNIYSWRCISEKTLEILKEAAGLNLKE
ncbi:glycosyltransferase family 4 protein [Bacillus sp. DX3.1]|uniref:glycosyltransferase family 4 protein n=1 Tax=Bacillus sp. DX3.1 TaxID=3052091 RepID=UPI0025711DF6|nr:glycosyltransferase family 4 protein [Bacillus sp. DX3.1]WJE84541.1 glycosyltransferase family 4 protein [Bacillus sp. DX3.1]